MSTENFGETPEEFDLDQWLDQGSRPQKTVKVYRDWSLMGELAALEEQITAVDQETDPSPGDIGAEELREQYQALLDKLAESALEVTLRALTNEEVTEISGGIPDKKTTFRDQHGKEQTRWKPDKIAVGDAIAAEAVVSVVDVKTGHTKSTMNRAQMQKMRERLGDGPTLVIYETVGELREAGRVLPDTPFSAGSSDDSQA